MPSSLEPTLKFLRQLKKNNNREWFAAHRDAYEAARAPYEALVENLIVAYNAIEPVHGLQVKDCVFRLNRDVRFSADKSPYRTNMGAVIGPGGRKSLLINLYVHVEPGASFAGGGLYMPEPAQLKAVRAVLAEDARPLRATLGSATFKKQFGALQGEQVKTAPKGYPSDHPDIDLLRHRQFLALRKFDDAGVLAAGFERELLAVARALRPFAAWCHHAVGLAGTK
jgi:uncharacterized protein (TIGR02453 family)